MKILFISHDAHRTGAPIVFLHLLNWLKKNSDIEIHILLKSGGPLESDFQQFQKMHIWKLPDKSKNLLNKIEGKLIDKTKNHHQKIIKSLVKEDFDLIYANSVASTPVLMALKNHLKAPIWLHVHELSMAINQYCGNELFKQLIPHVKKVIGVSKAVCKNLEEEYGIPQVEQELIYEYITMDKSPSEPKGYLKRTLNLNEEVFVVGGSGTTDWRKGPIYLSKPLMLFFKKIRILTWLLYG